MKNKHSVSGFILATSVACAPLLSPCSAHAEGVDVYSPKEKVFGRSFREWSAEWWQSVAAIPAGSNPITDTVGDRCGVGQRGPVWFLYGTLEEGSVTRNCRVPQSKALFFPVLNKFSADPITGHLSIADLRLDAATVADEVKTLSVKVDGKAVPNLKTGSRVKSIVFDLPLVPDGVYGVPDTACPDNGTCSPVVDDGFYVMLKPLAVGPHVIQIKGSSGKFSVDVTYNLTVVPEDFKGI